MYFDSSFACEMNIHVRQYPMLYHLSAGYFCHPILATAPATQPIFSFHVDALASSSLLIPLSRVDILRVQRYAVSSAGLLV